MNGRKNFKAQFTKDKGRPLKMLGRPIDALGWLILWVFVSCTCLGWPKEKIGRPLNVICELDINVFLIISTNNNCSCPLWRINDRERETRMYQKIILVRKWYIPISMKEVIGF